MKPNFVLSLSFDGLRLMHRVSGGWHLVGEVALDDADLTGALGRLRTAAEGLEPGGFSTKILIPNDQIKYLALDTTRAEREDVLQALHGATPYAVDDLVYDFAKGGGRTYVAAVAKETLGEAEQFAAEYGFNPVCFAAVPEPFTYVGEAFLGSVDGVTIERDEESVVVIGEADIVITAPEPAPLPEPRPEPPETWHDSPKDTADLDPEEEAHVPDLTEGLAATSETDVTPEPEPDMAETEVASTEDAPTPEPPLEEEIPDAPAGEVVDEPAESPEEPDTPETTGAEDPLSEPEAEIERQPDTDLAANPEPEAEVEKDATPDADPAPVFARGLRADRNEGRPTAPPIATPAASKSATREEPTFRRQSPPTLAVPTGKGTDPMPPLSAPTREAGTAPAAPIAQPITTQTPDVPDTDVAPLVTGEAPTTLAADAAQAATPVTAKPHQTEAPPAGELESPTEADLESGSKSGPESGSDADKPSAATAALGAATAVGGAVGGMFASRRMARADATQSADKPEEKSRLTVFGARKQPKKKEKIVVGGKPRFLGLILTAILLLFLLAIAAFAALSDESFARWLGFGSDDTQIAATPTADPTSALEVAAPQANDAPELASAEDAPAAPLAPTGGQILTPEQATRIYAATGVWQRAPRIPLTPRTTSLENMLLATALTPVVRVPSSPLVSASSVAGDALIATPIDPPPPSQTFEFDAEGLVIATPEGAVTPDGILVIVGRPPLTPPSRPGTIAPEIKPQDQLAAVIPETAEPVVDAPEGVIVIAGRPVIEPPVRTGTAVPAPSPVAAALADGEAPLLANDGLLVLAGTPPVLPPVRPGTVATSAAPAPEEPAPSTPEIANPATAQQDVRPEPQPEGLNVIAGPPPVLPPVRPGTLAPSTVPNAVPSATPETTAVNPTPPAPATPVVEPEGLNLIAGPPPVLPPIRPGTVAPQAAVDSLTQDIAAALSTATAQRPTADTRRPLNRPATIVQAAAAVANAPVLSALTASQAAGFRPRTRPAGLAPAPVPEPDVAVAPPAPPAPIAPQGLQIAPEIAAAVQAAANRPNPIATATALAVPRSARPDSRPRNMARIVERAAAAQQRATAQVASVAPRSVAPSGPTGGSVARAATLDNAINLRDVNLIGIYGGSGDRRALVRLGNGRYVRVTVGDRLDGGRVTAINAGALSYTKRGRAITLRVPG